METKSTFLLFRVFLLAIGSCKETENPIKAPITEDSIASNLAFINIEQIGIFYNPI